MSGIYHGYTESQESIQARWERIKKRQQSINSVRLFCPNCNQETDYTPFRTAAGITVLACACGECQDPIYEYSRGWEETRRDLLTSMHPF